MPPERHTYDLTGTVQGVGFRPSLFRLASEAGLNGWVQNRTGTVRLTLEGDPVSILDFMDHLADRLPEQAILASIRQVTRRPTMGDPLRGFRILESRSGDPSRVAIPVDLGVCNQCMQEIMDPADRHYRYAFTCCTNCGPRYTVIENMPYDRVRTTLGVFPLCKDCGRDYTSPLDRRFYAESTCCPVCGPQLDYRDASGKILEGDPLLMARRDLCEGKIVAVRGLGGFLLAVDAFNGPALDRLRYLKRRPHKPFAVMARTLQTATRYVELNNVAKFSIQSFRKPILVADATQEAFARLPMEQISPDGHTLGIMLPVAPLYILLMQDPGDEEIPAFDLLVMTSGNRRGEPICISNQEALERLNGIADRFLLHNRDINLRNDDSLCTIQCGREQVWRRARGFAPEPVQLTSPLNRCVLAMGAHLRNTIAVGYGTEMVLSPHVGDLDTPEALDGLKQVMNTLPRFLGRDPEAVAVDLHPDMHSTRLGREFARDHDLPVIEVQHHEAHAHACMLEHGLDTAFALVFDGTGLGHDGNIWGAELFHVDPDAVQRLASFTSVPLPGGDTAIRKPLRQLIARWLLSGIDAEAPCMKNIRAGNELISVLNQQVDKEVNTPLTTAAGRVFDSFSVWLGLVPDVTTYDGQAAVRLENCAAIAKESRTNPLPAFSVKQTGDRIDIDWSPFFRDLADLHRPDPSEKPYWALAFHSRIAEAACRMIARGRENFSTSTICLTGGVFMNRILCRLLLGMLEETGLRVFMHQKIPPNDGGIAAGQVTHASRAGT